MIQFAGGATDAQDGPLPPSALEWHLILHHCPSNCHTHPLQSYTGVAGGSFTSSSQSGFLLALNGAQAPAPFTRTVIQGSHNSISAPSTQTKGKKSWKFIAWSDGGEQTHDVTADSSATYTATYKPR